MLPVLLACLVLIALNACFVLMEFSLVKVRSSRIEVLARRGSSRAVQVQDMLAHLDEYLAAIQMGITVIALALGWIGEPALAAWLGGILGRLELPLRPAAVHGLAVGLGLAALSWVHIVFGELVPRSVGIQKADVIALWGAIPLRLFALTLRLPIHAMSKSSLYFLRLLGMKPAAESDSIVSEEEMRILLGETHEKGSFPLERLFLLENLFDLGSAKVAEAMVSREKVAFLSLSKSWEANLEIIRSRRFSRYPLCEDALDSVIGFVHVKDLIVRPDATPAPDLKCLRRDIAEITEGEPLEKLLKSFPDHGIHLAVVRNALGQVTGILTLEDIIEELIGEVQDEFDIQKAWSLADLIVPAAVAVQMQAADKRQAIAQLVGKLRAAHPELDEAETLRLVWEREMKFSSAVGRGVAVPHARLPSLERPLIALGRFVRPVPFTSPDNAPVRLLFLILTPAAMPVIQLKILGRIAALVTNENFRRKLLRAKTAEAVLELLRTADTVLA